MKQVVPNAVRVDTATFPLCVPIHVYESQDGEVIHTFLVTAWVFMAFLRKRFPKADVMDLGMIAGLCASVPPVELIGMAELMRRKFKDHPKTQLNIDLMNAIVDAFTFNEVSKEVFDELKGYNEQAIVEVEARRMPDRQEELRHHVVG